MKSALMKLALAFAFLCVCAASYAGEKVLVMLGDSTTLCSRNSPDAKLTVLVEKSLREDAKLDVKVINSGVGGNTSKMGYARLDKDVIAHNPDFVTVSFGLNDTGLLTPEEYYEFMERIIKDVKAKTKAEVMLITSTPFNNAKHPWGRKFEAQGGLDEYLDSKICAAEKELARKFDLRLCDLHGCFKEQFKSKGNIDVLILPDGVHLTDEGDREAAKFLAPKIAEMIKQAK